MKAQGTRQVRPVSLMNLQAIINLWGVPKEQIYAFHAMNVGSVGPPMPFGKKWGSSVSLRSEQATSKIFPTSGMPTPDCPRSSASNLHSQCMNWCRSRT